MNKIIGCLFTDTSIFGVKEGECSLFSQNNGQIYKSLFLRLGWVGLGWVCGVVWCGVFGEIEVAALRLRLGLGLGSVLLVVISHYVDKFLGFLGMNCAQDVWTN
jgi:hypothetical protein